MEVAYIPSPSLNVIAVGPLSIHFYALCIIAGILVAVWWGNRRFVALGGTPGVVADVAFWAVPFGIVGGRIYHLLTSWQSDRTFLDAIAIWRGGLGIWGAISLGALGAYLRYRKYVKDTQETSAPTFAVFMDALAPGIVIAQALGRWGNWFNIELFGRPTSLPWALEVPADKRPIGYESFETFHPTFLYESLWCIAVAAALLWISRRNTLRAGGIFLLYISLYSFGRLWIEGIRIDESQLLLGFRFNIWVSLILAFVGAIAAFTRRVGKSR